MHRLLLFTIYITFTVVNSATTLSYYQQELHQGRCSGDRLVDEDIIKTAAPYTTKKLTYTWKGNNMYYITCINVDNRLGGSDGGSVRIVEGGLGLSKVILEMISKNGKGMYFHLELYGEEVARNNHY